MVVVVLPGILTQEFEIENQQGLAPQLLSDEGPVKSKQV